MSPTRTADGYPREPDPPAPDSIIERCGLPRDETLAIGDREIDVLAGLASGVVACRFGGAARDTATDLAIDDFAELLRRLQAADR